MSDAFSWINLRFLLDGLWVTIQVSVVSIIFSMILGGIAGTVRYSNIPILSKVVGIIVDIIRNLPD